MGELFIQNDFTHGELDPELLARSDIVLYRKTGRKMRNVVVKPGGGAKRRFGTVFIEELPVSTNYKMIEFQFNENEKYLFIFIDNAINIYLDDVFQVQIASPYSGVQLDNIRLVQTTNLMIIAHPDISPRQISRGATPIIWALSPISFTNVPARDFNPGAYGAQTFTLSSAAVGAGITLDVSAGTFVFTDAFVGGLFIGPGADVLEPSGFSRITSRNSATQVVVTNIIAYAGVSITGNRAVVGEKAWSNLEPDGSGNRGWPLSVCFYQTRLYFGGSRSLPETIFASKVGDFIDFDTGTGLDDEAIIEDISSNKISDIKFLVADRSLQIFTFSSEWTPPQLEDQPLTPSNASIRKQSNEGVSNVAPIVLDNVTFYVKRGGRGVMAYEFSFENGSYNSTNSSIISAHLIRNPVDSAVLKGSDTEDANYLFVVNGDGTLAVYQTLKEQNVSAWTLSNTEIRTAINFDDCDPLTKPEEVIAPAFFRRATEVGNQIYFIVERDINGAVRHYLEKASFDVFMDCQKTQIFGSPTTTVGNLSHLEGQYVTVRGDDFVFTDQVVQSGTIELDDPATKVEVGIPYDTLIEVSPVVIQSQQGETNYIPKRINRVWLQYYKSLGIKVNDILIPNLQMNDTFTQDSLAPSFLPQTGSDQIYNEGYYVSPGGRVSERDPVNIIITQDDPLPMNVLAIGYEVTV